MDLTVTPIIVAETVMIGGGDFRVLTNQVQLLAIVGAPRGRPSLFRDLLRNLKS